MHFTVVFDSHESRDNSYGLVFVPCPVWIRGKQELLNLHPENPHYVTGDIRPLLEKEFGEADIDHQPKRAVVIVHEAGHGAVQDLERLTGDLEAAGFRPTTIRLDGLA